jgi:chromosomal replication initiation ATPase DnaA
MKTKLFDTILEVVHEVTEVDKSDIISTKKDDDYTEARVLLVWFCKLNGMHAPVIAKYIGRKSEESVNKMLRSFHEWNAASMMFRLYLKKIANILPARLEAVAESDQPTP